MKRRTKEKIASSASEQQRATTQASGGAPLTPQEAQFGQLTLSSSQGFLTDTTTIHR